MGRITDTSGVAVAGAVVHPRSLEDPSPAIPEMAVVSDAQGRYAWLLPPGRYEVSVQAETYRAAVKQTRVRRGEQTTLGFVLERIPPEKQKSR